MHSSSVQLVGAGTASAQNRDVDMILWDRPSRDARSSRTSGKAHVKLRRLTGCECRVMPGECEPFARLPDADAGNLKLFSIRQHRDDPAAFPWLEAKLAIVARR